MPGGDGLLGLLGENRGRRKQGDGGRDPHSLEIGGGRPPRNYDISVTFLLTGIKIRIFQHFQNKVAEIREETKFWG